MPAQLSKFIDIPCKEYSHPWVDSCVLAATGLGLNAVQESFRVYAAVYIAALLMKRKIPSKKDLKHTILGILQSTAFLSWSGFSFSVFICLLRQIFGKFHVLTVAFLPSFLSSLSAIFIERPSRQTLLSLYVSNIATETLFRMGVVRKYYSPIPRGGTYIFAASMALLLYFYNSKTNKQDSIYKILRIIVGNYENTDYVKETNLHRKAQIDSTDDDNNASTTGEHRANRKVHKKNVNIFMKSLQVYAKIIERLKLTSKHVSCPHPYSCAHYILKGGMDIFTYALGAQLVINIFLNIKKLIKKPLLMKSVIFKKGNLNLPVFVGCFTGLYRLISCLLRRLLQKNSSYHAIPAGFIGGLSFMIYDSNTISLYFMWKALQLLWNDLVEKEILPEVKWFPIVLYCFSTAVLFHAAILEPNVLRSSYWKFLYNVSGARTASMSRVPLDAFGLESTKHLANVVKNTNTVIKTDYYF